MWILKDSTTTFFRLKMYPDYIPNRKKKPRVYLIHVIYSFIEARYVAGINLYRRKYNI